MNAKILLIEDNEMNRYLATFLLEERGFAVSHAADGRTGLDLANRERFDLILLDIQLPLMNGHAVARAMRANPTLADVPIVADTVCVHGDGPDPVAFAKRLRAELTAAGIKIRAPYT